MLLPAVANDPDRLARFSREAQVLASLSIHATEAGIILGTAAYMSPEQARGRAVDRRTDIWAFGALLFEMLSARRPFEGETITDVIAAVITREPDWQALPAAATANLRRLLRRCLTKDPRERLQAIGDARLDIDEVLSQVSDETATTPSRRAAAVKRSSNPTNAIGSANCSCR